MPTRRLFYALWPDDEVRHALLHWQTANLDAGVRWQHRDDLHMTLHFLGQIDGARVDALAAIGEAAVVPAFDLLLEEIGHWPRPRILWAGPREVPGSLLQLHDGLESRLAESGFTAETRRYRPHVTLARRVRDRPTHAPIDPVSWRVNRFALVESHPGGAPHYRPLLQWRLGPAP